MNTIEGQDEECQWQARLNCSERAWQPVRGCVGRGIGWRLRVRAVLSTEAFPVFCSVRLSLMALKTHHLCLKIGVLLNYARKKDH